MNITKDKSIGTAALLAVAAAVVGISLQSGSKPGDSSNQAAATLNRTKTSTVKKKTPQDKPGCGSVRDSLADFLGLIAENAASCPDGNKLDASNVWQEARDASELKFVIALAPDPVHTHLSLLFDQIAVAIQEGAQDESYEFDSSWLPWDDSEPSYPLFSDQKEANEERRARENQPGIILFRHNGPVNKAKKENESKKGDSQEHQIQDYRHGLVVFVVGEEATDGIHREQFRNAVAWIQSLRSNSATGNKTAILGPTFSGSIPSLEQLFSDPKVKSALGFSQKERLAVYSGSVSSQTIAQSFASGFSEVLFHSFVQNDEEILKRFFKYMCDEQGNGEGNIAVISEDETAYGQEAAKTVYAMSGKKDKNCASAFLNLYYPRDISALRGAYQSKLLSQGGSSPQLSEIQKRNLPRDLADPAGRVRDSIRSYGGNQTPLAQEAFLMQILAELRDHQATYIVLRGSNSLDQLFLADFLRSNYPDGRIVLFSSDLLFMREQGANSLGGMMTLSTYPLVTHVHEWTEHPEDPAAYRVFTADAVEGVYIALRLLLNDKNFSPEGQNTGRCRVQEGKDNQVFLPPVECKKSPGHFPIPDYAPPFWINHEDSHAHSELYSGPPTWLSVIGMNRFWPVASLLETPAPPSPANSSAPANSPSLAKAAEDKSKDKNVHPTPPVPQDDPHEGLEIPLETKLFFLVLAALAAFHAWCCWSGSYTAKPAFRAHFASQGDLRHTALIFLGSFCIALLALVAGLGSGVFFVHPARVGLPYPWFAAICMFLVLALAGLALLLHGRTIRTLSVAPPKWLTFRSGKGFYYLALSLFVVLVFIVGRVLFSWLEHPLRDDVNRVLTHWRAMHLFSGLSPSVPILCLLAGLYVWFWYVLHGLALFGPDQPALPPIDRLTLSVPREDAKNGKPIEEKPLLRMFSHEDAATDIEKAATPLRAANLLLGAALFTVFLLAAWSLAGDVPIRSLGSSEYSLIFFVGLDLCGTLVLVCVWQLTNSWIKLKRLLTFLDRLTLRRTLAALHGFSWESVWKMSGNVLEVRYKVISRQIEAVNHTLAALKDALGRSIAGNARDLDGSRASLEATMKVARKFAVWYSENYRKDRAGDLTSFNEFQKSVAATSGTLLTKLLIPAWRAEEDSLIADPYRPAEDKEGSSSKLPRAKEAHIRNAEELVCLTYLGFIQNALGRLRTIALSIVMLFLACTLAVSSYPFDPRQGLSTILVILFVVAGMVIIKVYAEMHRDSTLSHVTNTRPGELGSEFWFKILAFGFAPLIGLLARIFPGVIDFILSWIQPGISSLK